jgi:hypothetical protein
MVRKILNFNALSIPFYSWYTRLSTFGRCMSAVENKRGGAGVVFPRFNYLENGMFGGEKCALND